MAALKILSLARERAFKRIPKLSKEDKNVYFIIDVETRKYINKIRTDVNKVGFLVSKVYFQTKGQFYKPALYDKKDIRCAQKVLSIKHDVDMNEYRQETFVQHKRLIMNHFGWTPFTKLSLPILTEYANNLVAVRQNKEDVLFSLVNYCWQHRIEIPTYATFSVLITDCFKHFDERLANNLQRHATKSQTHTLDAFIDAYGSEYSAKELRKIEQGHTQKTLNENARILSFYKSYFSPLVPLYKKLDLTDEAIKHFAETIEINDVLAIKRLGKTSKSHLLNSAFIKNQYYSRNDFAADAVIKVVTNHANSARGHERKKREAGLKNLNEDNKSIVTSARDLKHVLKMILSITESTDINLHEKNEKVRQLVIAFFEAETPDFDDTLARVDHSLDNQLRKADFYTALFAKSMSMQRELGALVNEISFDKDSRNTDLINAIALYKTHPKTIDENAPIGFLAKAEQELLLEEDEFTSLNKFRVLLLMSICKALKERSITIEHSYKYRHPAHYLITDEEWANNRDRLLKAVCMEKFEDGETVLKNIGQKVSQAYVNTNKRIELGENALFTLKSDGEWFVSNLDADFSMAKVIPSLLSASRGVSLQEIMFEVDRYTDLHRCFTNRLPTGGNTEINKRLLFATIMSLGTNLGHAGLARATKSFSEKALHDTEKSWISKRNIIKANNVLVQMIQALSLPAIYNDSDGVLHTSSDGKKVVINVNSLLANYSYKYYGKEQGVSVNSFLDEKQSLFCVNVLTSSDREAPYVLEGLVASKNTIATDKTEEHLHSTDTHGYTEATFAALHFLEVSFAPRIKNVGRQSIYAYDLASKKANAASPLSPKKQINKKLILENWDDILRLMVSMKLGRCSSSQMMKTLSASEKASPLYQGLKEFGRLLKTNFILRYVDDEELRQSIHKQLNRVELGQKLTGKVLFGRHGKLQVGLKEEVSLVTGCNALLRNMIILWNYFFLSDHCIKIADPTERAALIETIGSGSVIAWAHINFLGTYDFDENTKSLFTATFQQMKSMDI